MSKRNIEIWIIRFLAVYGEARICGDCAKMCLEGKKRREKGENKEEKKRKEKEEEKEKLEKGEMDEKKEDMKEMERCPECHKEILIKKQRFVLMYL